MKTFKVRLQGKGTGYQVTVRAEDASHAIVRALIENPEMKNAIEIFEMAA